MTLQEQFKKETKEDAYYLDQTIWNDYYIDWLEKKVLEYNIHNCIND